MKVATYLLFAYCTIAFPQAPNEPLGGFSVPTNPQTALPDGTVPSPTVDPPVEIPTVPTDQIPSEVPPTTPVEVPPTTPVEVPPVVLEVPPVVPTEQIPPPVAPTDQIPPTIPAELPPTTPEEVPPTTPELPPTTPELPPTTPEEVPPTTPELPPTEIPAQVPPPAPEQAPPPTPDTGAGQAPEVPPPQIPTQNGYSGRKKFKCVRKGASSATSKDQPKFAGFAPYLPSSGVAALVSSVGKQLKDLGLDMSALTALGAGVDVQKVFDGLMGDGGLAGYSPDELLSKIVEVSPDLKPVIDAVLVSMSKEVFAKMMVDVVSSLKKTPGATYDQAVAAWSNIKWS